MVGIEFWGGICRSLFLIAGFVNLVSQFHLCYWLEQTFSPFPLIFFAFHGVVV